MCCYGGDSLSSEILLSESRSLRLVGDTKYDDDVLVLGFRDELGDDTNIVK